MNNKEQEKASEIFEGENSSLRKTFDEAVPPEEKLREEFKKKARDMLYFNDNNFTYKDLEEIADWWLEKISSHNARLIERVEGKKRDIVETAINNSEILLTVDFGYNQAIDDILQIIKEEQL